MIVIILIFSYVNTYLHDINENKYFKESFTPRIREMYRPYLRDTRIFTNNMYNQHKNNITNFLRKIGFM